jgi:ribosome biogenesis GTPase / thiamine phosphate phosphatase
VPAAPPADDPFLVAHGWSESVRARWVHAVSQLAGSLAPTDGMPVAGRVVRTSRRFTYVATPDGLVQAMALRDLAPEPVSGDWVALLGESEEHGVRVAAVAERSSALVRRDPAGRTTGQVLAANVDWVLAVFGLDRPVRPGRVERSLVLAHDSGATPVVVLTKADTLDDDQSRAITDEVTALAGSSRIVTVAAGDETGIGALQSLLRPNRTAVLLGESGAGKSTLVNRLAGRSVQRTAEVRDTDAKGRHTTVTRDLVVLDGGGVVIDAPGLRALGLLDTAGGLDAAYDDITTFADDCRFRDCAHGEEPGCAVRSAVATGELDADRLDRYLAVVAELRENADAQVEAARRPRGRPAAP